MIKFNIEETLKFQYIRGNGSEQKAICIQSICIISIDKPADLFYFISATRVSKLVLEQDELSTNSRPIIYVTDLTKSESDSEDEQICNKVLHKV